jgi:hypothetical protein
MPPAPTDPPTHRVVARWQALRAAVARSASQQDPPRSTRRRSGACAVAGSSNAGAPRGWAARPGWRRQPPGRGLVHGLLPALPPERRVMQPRRRRPCRQRALVQGVLPHHPAARCPPHPAPPRGRRGAALVYGLLPMRRTGQQWRPACPCPPIPPALRDRRPPWRQRVRLRAQHGAVLRRRQATGRTGRRHQLRRHPHQARGEIRRQPVEAARRRVAHKPAPERGEVVAVARPRRRAVGAVHGARGAQPRHPLGGARTGAAPAMRSLPAVGLAPLEPATGLVPVGRLSRGLTRGAAQFSPDRRRAARAAAAGTRAPRVKPVGRLRAARGRDRGCRGVRW